MHYESHMKCFKQSITCLCRLFPASLIFSDNQDEGLVQVVLTVVSNRPTCHGKSYKQDEFINNQRFFPFGKRYFKLTVLSFPCTHLPFSVGLFHWHLQYLNSQKWFRTMQAKHILGNVFYTHLHH